MIKTYSASEIIDYLEKNYLSIEQLANQANVSIEQVQAFISNACVPKYSHKSTHQIAFRAEIFGDTITTEQEKFYYHPSLVKWAVTTNQYLKTLSISETANKIKSDFTQELCQALIEVEGAKQVFNYCFDDHGNLLDAGVNKVLTAEWPYLMDGTYGVCLKDISAKNIIIKAVSIFALEKWINDSEAKNRKDQYPQALRAAELYDSVAAYFGPHEIIKSTRGRLFNKFKDWALDNDIS